MPTAPYKLKDGTRVPGTTTIISRFKDSGGLMHWAFKQGQSGVAHLYEKAEEAADIGTIAHAMVEAHISGGKLKDALRGFKITKALEKKARKAFDAYLEWEKSSKLKIVEQEINLVSENFRYGGTPDAIGMIGNSLCLVDWKTSNGVYPDYAIQLAAYKNLWEENFPDRPLNGFHLCRFSKDYPDFEHRYFGELPEAWELFKLYRYAYDLDKELKRRIK